MLSIGCDATTRYNVLSTVFDGVPPPSEEKAVSAEAQTSPARPAGRFGDHGPYAAKLCTACHASAASNTFVVPKNELCFHCHDIKIDKKYVHGPLASGGCTSCHDPHGSRYRYLLIAEGDSFCVGCHNPKDVEKNPAHAGVDGHCTSCHDPHMSDRKYLLR